MKRVITYTRADAAKEVHPEPASRQRESICHYIHGAKLRLAASYHDADVPLTASLRDRIGLVSAIEHALVRDVKLVLISRQDRLHPSPVVAQSVLHCLSEFGIQVISTDTGMELTSQFADKANETIRHIARTAGVVYRSMTPISLRVARIRKTEQTGRCEGRKPYGYWSWEKDVIKRIRQLRRKPRNQPRRSWAEIALILNEEYVRTRSGRRWTAASVRKVASRLIASPRRAAMSSHSHQ